MPLYIRLVKFTEKGITSIHDIGKRRDEAKKRFDAEGAKVLVSYVTLGSYDLVTIFEAPDNAAAIKLGAWIASNGNVCSETLVAIPAEEFERMAESL